MVPKFPWLALLALLLLMMGRASASAQAGNGSTSTAAQGTIDINLLKIGEEDVNTFAGEVFLGLEDCTKNAPILFDVDQLPDAETLDVYVGTNCSETDRDDDDNENCRFIDTLDINMQVDDLQVTITSDKLFRSCDGGTNEDAPLWFLAVDISMQNAEPKAFGTIELTLDSDPPNAPTDLSGGSGESQIPISWNSSERDLEQFVVYIDSNPTSGGSSDDMDGGGTASNGNCGSLVLTAGGSATDLPSDIRKAEIDEATATGTELTPGQIGGMRAAIAVSTQDRAGNLSPLSNIACVEVVPTQSFWDRYKDNGGDAEGGCGCRTAGREQLLGGWPIALALLALWRSARRRAS